MKKILSFLENAVFGKLDTNAEQGELSFARRVRELLSECPSCDLSFRRHNFCSIAGTIYTDDNRYRCEELRLALRTQEFDTILGFDEFDPFEDALLVGIIRCPSGNAVWLLIRAPYDPRLRPAIMEFNVVPADESPRLLGLVADGSWVEFEDS